MGRQLAFTRSKRGEVERGITAGLDTGSRSIDAKPTSGEGAGSGRPGWVVLVVGASACFVAFFGLALLFAITMPYHGWDAFAYGEWSRRIATGGSLDPRSLGPYVAGRPLFLGLQGVIWWFTGVSFAAGRLLSLGFAVVAAIATMFMVESREERAFTLIAFLSIAVFAQEAISGLTDVPAAAAVASVCAVALTPAFRRQRQLVLVVALLAVLTKPSSVLPALFGLALALLIVERPRSRRGALGTVSLALGVGALLGLVYDWVMAIHLKMGLFAFLRAGTTGYYAQLANSLRADTILRLDFLGPDLRLPLAFVLVYGLACLAGLRHRRAAIVALAIGGGYALIGPFLAGDKNGPFTSAYSGFAFIGFALLFSVIPLAPSDLQPGRTRTIQLFLIALPPTAVWAVFGVYEYRLEAPAWPALAGLIGICITCSVRVLQRFAGVAALAPIAVLAVAVWGSMVSMDGFHGPLWTEYRALGLSGIWNRADTTNIVLPAVSETVAALQSQIGTNGKLIASDPHFLFWFPHTTIEYPTKCSDLRGQNGFVLSTADESQMVMREAGGSPDPKTWAACTNPHLRQLTDGSNGLAAFVVVNG